MKTTLYILSSIIASIIISCNKLDGFATPPDFSNRNLTVSNKNVEITLRARNDVNWIFSQFQINGTLITGDEWDINPLIEYKTSVERDSPYFSSPYQHLTGIYYIKYADWVVIEKIGNTIIKIILSENTSDLNREVRFQAFAGNASETIHIVQEAGSN